MEKEPSKRMTSQAALGHRWLEELPTFAQQRSRTQPPNSSPALSANSGASSVPRVIKEQGLLLRRRRRELEKVLANGGEPPLPPRFLASHIESADGRMAELPNAVRKAQSGKRKASQTGTTTHGRGGTRSSKKQKHVGPESSSVPGVALRRSKRQPKTSA